MAELPSNSYINQFSNPNERGLAALAQVDRQITLERRSWEQSGAAEQTAQIALEVFQKWGILQRNIRPNALEYLADMHRACMFGDQDVDRAANYAMDRHFSNLPKRAHDEINAVVDILDNHATAYSDTVQPLFSERGALFGDLLGSWKIYITEAPTHFKDFSEFLTDDVFTEMRTPQRPFLVQLEQQRRRDQKRGPLDLIESMKRKALAESVDSPDRESMDSFIVDLENKTFSSKKGGNELSQWLRFASYPAENVDPDRMLEIIRAGQFPASFKLAFEGFLGSAINTDANNVRTALNHYKPEQGPTFNMDLRGGINRKKGNKIVTTNIATQVSIPKTPKIEYVLIAGGKIAPDQEAITDYVKAEARESRNNPALLADLVGIINVIKINPYAIGVRRLVRNKLLYFSTHENPTFKTNDPRTDKYRLVFDVVNAEGDDQNKRRIEFENLVPHDKFDQLYKS